MGKLESLPSHGWDGKFLIAPAGCPCSFISEGTESKALTTLGKHPTTELHHQPLPTVLNIFLRAHSRHWSLRNLPAWALGWELAPGSAWEGEDPGRILKTSLLPYELH